MGAIVSRVHRRRVNARRVKNKIRISADGVEEGLEVYFQALLDRPGLWPFNG
jgi:hypothetical protein